MALRMENRKELFVRPLEKTDKTESVPKRFLLAPKGQPILTTRLTDVNDDCLEYIFKLLPMEDLLNIADVSKYFHPAVSRVYHYEYGVKAKHLDVSIHKYKQNRPIDLKSDKIEITDLQTAFQLLRLFGYAVKKLEVNIKDGIKHGDVLYQYINKYCSENLRVVHFQNKMPDKGYPVGTFKKPFKNLEIVTFEETCLGGEITDFNKWFPKMKKFFTMDRVYFDDSKCVEIKFKSVETLRLTSATPRDSVAAALKLNPQIRHLELWCGYSGLLLEVASEYLPDLEQLSVLWESYATDNLNRISRMNGDKIYFGKLKKMHLFLENKYSYTDESVPLPKIPITFGPITEFHFYTRCTLGNEFVEFLKRHQTIQHLFIDAAGYQGQFFLPLPFVMKKIFNPKLPLYAIAKFMDVFKCLQKFGTLQLHNLHDDETDIGDARFELENVKTRFDGTLFHFKRVK